MTNFDIPFALLAHRKISTPSSKCGNLYKFSATKILREINFGWFRITILSIFRGLEVCYFSNSPIFKCEICQKLTLKASKFLQIAIFDLLKSAKMLSRKICVAVKIWNFHTVFFKVVLITFFFFRYSNFFFRESSCKER